MSNNAHFNETAIAQITVEDAFPLAMQPTTEGCQLLDLRDTADSSTGFMNILFDSPFRDLSTSMNATNTNLSGNMSINSLINPDMEVLDCSVISANPRHTIDTSNDFGQIWPGKSQPSIRPYFWQEIAFDSAENIFSSYGISSYVDLAQGSPSEIDTVDASLTGEVKDRLCGLKKNILSCPCDNIWTDQQPCAQHYICTNTTEVFDQGLYLYLHRYQPSYPILHPATFHPTNVSELLLFVMCMIGISFLKTEDASNFIRQTYPVCGANDGPALLQD